MKASCNVATFAKGLNYKQRHKEAFSDEHPQKRLDTLRHPLGVLVKSVHNTPQKQDIDSPKGTRKLDQELFLTKKNSRVQWQGTLQNPNNQPDEREHHQRVSVRAGRTGDHQRLSTILHHRHHQAIVQHLLAAFALVNVARKRGFGITGEMSENALHSEKNLEILTMSIK